MTDAEPMSWHRLLDSLYADGPDIGCVRQWGRFVVYRRPYWSAQLQGFVQNPDETMARGIMLKDGDSTTVVLLELDGYRYVVKRYNIRNLWYALRRLFRPTRAWHCWRNAHHLQSVSIRTPAPVLMLEQRWGPLRRKAYFVTQWVDGPDVLQYLAGVPLSGAPENMAVWQHTLSLFRGLFEGMRRNRLIHGDCKATNFIINDSQLHVLDLDAMRQERTKRSFGKYFQRDLRRFRANWSQDERATVLIKELFSELNVKVDT